MLSRSPTLGHGASLRTRLVALSVAALIPGFGVIAFTQYQVNQSRQAEVRELAMRSARQAALEFDRIMSGVQALLVAVSYAPVVQNRDEASCTSYLAELVVRS